MAEEKKSLFDLMKGRVEGVVTGAKNLPNRLNTVVEENTRKITHRFGVPTKKEFDELSKETAKLRADLNNLLKSKKTPPSKKTAKKEAPP